VSSRSDAIVDVVVGIYGYKIIISQISIKRVRVVERAGDEVVVATGGV